MEPIRYVEALTAKYSAMGSQAYGRSRPKPFAFDPALPSPKAPAKQLRKRTGRMP